MSPFEPASVNASFPSFHEPSLIGASPSCELLVPVTLSPSTFSVNRNGNGCPFASATASHWPLRLRGTALAGLAGAAAACILLSSIGDFSVPTIQLPLILEPSVLPSSFPSLPKVSERSPSPLTAPSVSSYDLSAVFSCPRSLPSSVLTSRVTVLSFPGSFVTGGDACGRGCSRCSLRKSHAGAEQQRQGQ